MPLIKLPCDDDLWEKVEMASCVIVRVKRGRRLFSFRGFGHAICESEHDILLFWTRHERSAFFLDCSPTHTLRDFGCFHSPIPITRVTTNSN